MAKRLQHLRTLAESEIRDLVKDDELVRASLLLVDFTEIFAPSQNGDAIVIAGRVKKHQKEKIIGIIDYNTLTEENTRLSNSIIKLLESVSIPAPAF